jgi:ankyrin repeat protein
LGLARLLISKNANVNLNDNKKSTPLMYACMFGSLQVAKLLIENMANTNARDHKGNTPLIYICDQAKIQNEKIKIELVRLLLKHNAKVDIENSSGQIALHKACASFSIDVVKLLLSADKSTINHHEKEGGNLVFHDQFDNTLMDVPTTNWTPLAYCFAPLLIKIPGRHTFGGKSKKTLCLIVQTMLNRGAILSNNNYKALIKSKICNLQFQKLIRNLRNDTLTELYEYAINV